jgi:hypothetical protein
VPYSVPEEVIDHIYNLLDTNKVTLGLGFVGYGDVDLIPEYPAAVVTGSPLDREIHATRQFKLTFRCNIWVYHAKMTDTHKSRTQDDLILASDIRGLIHQDKTFGGNLIFGYVENEDPGIMVRPRKEVVVGTRLGWTGESVVPFDLP